MAEAAPRGGPPPSPVPADAESRVNEARGEAAKMLQEATAYKERVVREASGDAERFNLIYDQYRRNPSAAGRVVARRKVALPECCAETPPSTVPPAKTDRVAYLRKRYPGVSLARAEWLDARFNHAKLRRSKAYRARELAKHIKKYGSY